MNIVLLGAPGSGKGFLSNLLIDDCGFVHISTGNLLRENMKNKTELGLKIVDFMNNGDLVPDNLVFQVLEKAVEENSGKDIIFDGYPRNIEQAVELQKIAKIDFVFYIDVPEDIILERILARRVCSLCSAVYSIKTYNKSTCEKCGSPVVHRSDDTESVVTNRLKKYNIQTKPLINYYKQKGNLICFSDGGDTYKTFARIKEIIKK